MSRFMNVYTIDNIDDSIYSWTTEQWVSYAMEGSEDWIPVKKEDDFIIKIIKQMINFVAKIVKTVFTAIKKAFIRIKRWLQGTGKYENHGAFRIGNLYYIANEGRSLLYVFDGLLGMWNKGIWAVADGSKTDQDVSSEMQEFYNEQDNEAVTRANGRYMALKDFTLIVDTSKPHYIDTLIDKYTSCAETIKKECDRITKRANQSGKVFNNPKYEVPNLCKTFQLCIGDLSSKLMNDAKNIELAIVHAKRDMDNLELKTEDGWYYDTAGAHHINQY